MEAEKKGCPSLPGKTRGDLTEEAAFQRTQDTQAFARQTSKGRASQAEETASAKT